MIRVDVKPRSDNKFDIYVSEDGEPLLNSNQGYENVEDAIAVARRLFGPVQFSGKAADRAIALRVQFRDGTTHTEQLR